ncbi:hypothetical protein BPSP_1630 [Bifidobacterium pseudolongum subsp. pseudolongum]|nr:hypothetical protein BPSP_1630 [Bifidobacterium pseudolongum subsp. pseudolongum]
MIALAPEFFFLVVGSNLGFKAQYCAVYFQGVIVCFFIEEDRLSQGQNVCLAGRCFSMVCRCGIRSSRCRCRIWRGGRVVPVVLRRCAPMPVGRVVRSARRAMRGGLAMRRFRGARCAGGTTSTRP